MFNVGDRVKFVGHVVNDHSYPLAQGTCRVRGEKQNHYGYRDCKTFCEAELEADSIPEPAEVKAEAPKFKVGDPVLAKKDLGHAVEGMIEKVRSADHYAVRVCGGDYVDGVNYFGFCPADRLQPRDVPTVQEVDPRPAGFHQFGSEFYKGLASACEDKIKERDREIAELKTVIACQRQRIDEIESYKATLAKGAAADQRESRRLTKCAAELGAENADLKASLSRCERIAKEKVERIAELEEKIRVRKYAHDHAYISLESCKKRVAELEQAESLREVDSGFQDKAVKEYAQRIDDLQRRNGWLQRELGSVLELHSLAVEQVLHYRDRLELKDGE